VTAAVPVVVFVVRVTFPLYDPVVVGSKLTIRFADWPGFRVIGRAIPDTA